MKKILYIIILIIMGITCNSPISSNGSTPSNDTITTDNITEGPFYFDLNTSSETTETGTWQFSFQMIDVDFGGTTYQMPSLVLNSSPGTIMSAIYDNQTFDEITSIPTTFSSAPYADALTDLTSVKYGGTNEVIEYNMSTHIASINNANEVLLIYSMTTHKTWKIQFIEYSNGVTLFKFDELEL